MIATAKEPRLHSKAGRGVRSSTGTTIATRQKIAAIKKKESSIPTNGSKMKPATSGPNIAPTVLKRVAIPEVRADDPNSSLMARFTIVNAIPDNAETGNIKNDANPTNVSVDTAEL